MNQVSIPVDIRPEEVAREKTLGEALHLCAKLAGFGLDKELQQQLGTDKSQFSRWMGGTEGIVWPKFTKLMDVCGNDASVHAGPIAPPERRVQRESLPVPIRQKERPRRRSS